jgi:hypothetical protein
MKEEITEEEITEEEKALLKQQLLDDFLKTRKPKYEDTIEYDVDCFKKTFDEEFLKYKKIFPYLNNYNVKYVKDAFECGCCRKQIITVFMNDQTEYTYTVTISSRNRDYTDAGEYGTEFAKRVCLEALNNNVYKATACGKLKHRDGCEIIKIKGITDDYPPRVITETIWEI